MNHKTYVEEFSEISLIFFPAMTILLADGNDFSTTERDYLFEEVYRLVGEKGIFPDVSEEEVTSECRKTIAHINEITIWKEKCLVSNECCIRLWQRSFFPGANKNEQTRILKFWYDLANADSIITPEQGQVLGQFTQIISFGVFDSRWEYLLNQFSFNGYSLRNIYVFDEDPVTLLIKYNSDVEKKLDAFKKKYPHLIDRFSISNSELLFTISYERQISSQNWTINFLESNLNHGRSTNGEGSALSNEFYKDLFNLFKDNEEEVCFGNTGDIECAMATVGAFDCSYSFKLVEGGIEWREDN